MPFYKVTLDVRTRHIFYVDAADVGEAGERAAEAIYDGEQGQDFYYTDVWTRKVEEV